MCGEHADSSSTLQELQGSSPHVRGAPELKPVFRELCGIIPACAGSTGAAVNGLKQLGDHPRMCGEHARRFCQLAFMAGSSPHVRGARVKIPVISPRLGIIPACAGSTLMLFSSIALTRDHPRMCGEHPLLLTLLGGTAGSSPHVRGAPAACLWPIRRVGIIPACAGSTRLADERRAGAGDHPRMCGEHTSKIA